MTKALANQKATERKAAVKNAAAKGIIEPKFSKAKPGSSAFAPPAEQGIDKPAPVVSNQVSPSETPKESTVTKPAEKTMIDKKAEAEAAGRAKAQKELDELKAKKAAEAKAKKEAAEAEKAAKKAEREKQFAENKSKREAAIAEKQAAAAEAGSKRTYFGSMTALADRTKSGSYVKGLNGQLRSTDEVAVALEGVLPADMPQLGMAVLALEANPYAHLNVGQQSMNFRNKIRGAIKAGNLTLDKLKEIRDAGGYAKAEKIAAEKAQEKAANKAKREAEAKAKKEAADAAKKAEAEKKAAVAAAAKKETAAQPAA